MNIMNEETARFLASYLDATSYEFAEWDKNHGDMVFNIDTLTRLIIKFFEELP